MNTKEEMTEGATAIKQRAAKPNYAEWLIDSYRLLLVRWAQLFIIIMCFGLLHPTGRLPVYRVYALAFIISSMGICRSSTSPAGSCKKVQFWFGVFALFQVVSVCQMAYTGVAPLVHNFLDWAVNLSTLVPQMLVLDLPPAKSALFLLTHTLARTAFYCSVVGHATPLAFIRAICLIAMCGGVFLNFRRRAVATYLQMTAGNPFVCHGPAGSAMASARAEHPPSPQKKQEGVAQRIVDDANATSSQGTINSGTASVSSCPSQPQSSTRQHLHSVPPGSPLQRAKAAVLATKHKMPKQKAFVSRLPHSCETTHFLQAAYRLAVKVDGQCHPDNMPGGALTDLQNRLQRYQRLSPAESPAVRAGCVVIGFGSAPRSQGSSVEETRCKTEAEAKEWALEHGLLLNDEVLTLQACRQSSWVSTNTCPGNDTHPQHSIFVREPFLEILPSSLEEWASCAFDLTLIAPDSHRELRGWRGAADAPEDLPEDLKSSLVLLASCDGQFLKTSVEQHSCITNGEWSVQVQIDLPAANLKPKVLVLELWASGSLVCSHSAVLLPVTGVLTELKGLELVGSSCEDSSVFVRDLVIFLHFQASHSSSVLEEGKLGHGSIGKSEVRPDPADDEVLLMWEVGQSLLEYSLENGMCTLAGLLQHALASHPFPPSAACDSPDALPLAAEHQEQHHRVHPQPKPAEHSASPSWSLNPAALATAATACDKQAKAQGMNSASPSATQEEEYQAWKSLQNASLVRSCCLVQVVFMSIGALRRWYESEGWEGTALVLKEVAYLFPVFPTYLLGALFICRAGSYTELFLAIIIAARASSAVLLGLGVVPLPPVFIPLIQKRLEVLVEIWMVSAFEQVRLTWLVPLRIALTIGFGYFYMRSGIVSPWAQAILLNACCLLASKIIDTRYRRLYARAQSEAKRVKSD